MTNTQTTFAERARAVPDCLNGLDRVDLIGSGNVVIPNPWVCIIYVWCVCARCVWAHG